MLLVLLPYIVAIIVSELRNLRLFAKFLSFLAVISLSIGVSALPLIYGILILSGHMGITVPSSVSQSWSYYIGNSNPLYNILLGRLQPYVSSAPPISFLEYYTSQAFLIIAAAVVVLALIPLLARPARRVSAGYSVCS